MAQQTGRPVDGRNTRAARRALLRGAKKAGLCRHGAETRSYASLSEANSDTAPTEICDRCGRRKIIAALIPPEGMKR
jgi:superfamily II helicase